MRLSWSSTAPPLCKFTSISQTNPSNSQYYIYITYTSPYNTATFSDTSFFFYALLLTYGTSLHLAFVVTARRPQRIVSHELISLISRALGTRHNNYWRERDTNTMWSWGAIFDFRYAAVSPRKSVSCLRVEEVGKGVFAFCCSKTWENVVLMKGV